MKYDFQYIENNVDKRLYNVIDQFEALRLQEDNVGLHNQNRINLEFAESPVYRDYNCYDEFFEVYKTLEEKDKRPFQLEVFEKIRESYIKFDQELYDISPSQLTYEKLEKYLKLLPRHLDAMHAAYTYTNRKYKVLFCRFGCNRLVRGLNKEDTEYVLYNTRKIKKLLDSDYDFTSGDKLGINWHTFLNTCWILIEGGVAEVSLEIAETILKLFDKQVEMYKTAAQFTFVALYQSMDVRSRFTVLWIKAFSLIQIGKIEEAKAVLQHMVTFLLDSTYHSYVIYNRMTEASIILYRLEPSEKHKKQAEESLILTSKEILHESTETVRERGLIIYDFCKYVLKQDI